MFSRAIEQCVNVQDYKINQTTWVQNTLEFCPCPIEWVHCECFGYFKRTEDQLRGVTYYFQWVVKFLHFTKFDYFL